MLALDTDALISDIGAFWVNGMDAESRRKLSLVRAAATTSRLHASLGGLESSVMDATGPQVVEGIDFVFTPYAHTDTPDWYHHSCAMDVMPLVMHEGAETLVLGVHYVWDSVQQRVRLRGGPRTRQFVVARGLRVARTPMLLGPLYGLHHESMAGESAEVACYLRVDQSLPQFQRALRAAAGLRKFTADGTIKRVVVHGNVTTYVTQTETLRTDYVHDRLRVGERVTAGQWVGGENVSLRWDDGSVDWYRHNDWTESGLDLSGVTGLAGLVASDVDTEVVDSGGVLRLAAVMGYADSDTSFWAGVAAREASVGGGLGLVYEVGDTVNPIDMWFKHSLTHAIILTIDARIMHFKYIINIINWFIRNTPFGFLPFVRIIGGDGKERDATAHLPSMPAFEWDGCDVPLWSTVPPAEESIPDSSFFYDSMLWDDSDVSTW